MKRPKFCAREGCGRLLRDRYVYSRFTRNYYCWPGEGCQALVERDGLTRRTRGRKPHTTPSLDDAGTEHAHADGTAARSTSALRLGADAA